MDISAVSALLNTHTLGRNMFHFTALGSTSTYIRNRWQSLPDGFTVSADEQLSGRGRSGKSFFSPKGDGLYVSFLLKSKIYLEDPLFTVRISYAVCRAIDRLTDTEDVKIKWVNDIYSGRRKIAGILCEAPGGAHKGIIVGVGVNFTADKASVPAELRNKIGSLRDVTPKKLSKERLCAYLLNEVEGMYGASASDEEFFALYRRRSAVLGKEINVLKGDSELRAAALDIAPDGGLIVRYPSGITEKLTAGEISIVVSG